MNILFIFVGILFLGVLFGSESVSGFVIGLVLVSLSLMIFGLLKSEILK